MMAAGIQVKRVTWGQPAFTSVSCADLASFQVAQSAKVSKVKVKLHITCDTTAAIVQIQYVAAGICVIRQAVERS